jgi:hypothetical protein
VSFLLLDYPHKGVYGYRVTRMVAGRVYWKFFSLIDKSRRGTGSRGCERLEGEAAERVRQRALDYDAELARMYWTNRRHLAQEAWPSARARKSSTVRGISFYKQGFKSRTGVQAGPGFLVRARRPNGRMFSSYIPIRGRIDEQSWEAAWMTAVYALAKGKELQNWERLAVRVPDLALAVGGTGTAGSGR